MITEVAIAEAIGVLKVMRDDLKTERAFAQSARPRTIDAWRVMLWAERATSRTYRVLELLSESQPVGSLLDPDRMVTQVVTGDLITTFLAGNVEEATSQIRLLQTMVIVEKAKVADQQAVLYRLPVLADGTHFIPVRDDDDNHLYHPENPSISHFDVTWDDEWLVCFPDLGYYPASECWRTEAAARAAKESKQGDDDV